jgi:hypothetical protein
MFDAKRTLTPTAWPMPLWTGRPSHDDGREPARPGAVSSVGTKQVRVARRAKFRHEDLFGQHSGAFKLLSHGSPPVEEPVLGVASVPHDRL